MGKKPLKWWQHEGKKGNDGPQHPQSWAKGGVKQAPNGNIVTGKRKERRN